MIPIRRKPTQAELQQAHIELLCRISSPMYGNGRGARMKPQRTQPIPVDAKTIHNVKTEGEGTKTPQSASKEKQPVKEKKARGKKDKKSNPNEDSPKKQVSVFEIKEYRLGRRLKHKPICKVHGMGFNSWLQYCEHLIEMHGHLKQYLCKLCKKECSSLQAFTVHCAKPEEDNKRFQCKICLQKFMFPSTLKNHMCKHEEPIFECPCKDGPRGVPCGKKFKYKEMYKHDRKTHDLPEIKCLFEGCLRTFISGHYMKDNYSLMHGEPLQCENVLSGCNFHTCSRSTLVKHERYFCEFREVMQVEEDKYLKSLKSMYKYVPSMSIF